MMRDKLQAQRQMDQAGKVKALDDQIKKLQKQVQEVDDDNNIMWDEIQELQGVVPAQSIDGINTIDRQSFLTE